MTSVAGAWFTVSFEGDADAELAARALASVERSADRIGQVLSAYPIQPIPIVLYTTNSFAISRGPRSGLAGAYDGTVRVPMRGALANPQELGTACSRTSTHTRSCTASRRETCPRGCTKDWPQHWKPISIR
jgi:hypothetical protein